MTTSLTHRSVARHKIQRNNRIFLLITSIYRTAEYQYHPHLVKSRVLSIREIIGRLGQYIILHIKTINSAPRKTHSPSDSSLPWFLFCIKHDSTSFPLSASFLPLRLNFVSWPGISVDFATFWDVYQVQALNEPPNLNLCCRSKFSFTSLYDDDSKSHWLLSIFFLLSFDPSNKYYLPYYSMLSPPNSYI